MATSETSHRIYATPFGSVHPHYLTKAEKKGRTKREADQIVRWLTGYSQRQLMAQVHKGTDFQTSFANAPDMEALAARSSPASFAACEWGT